MDIVNFAIWKFRYVEGLLEGMNSYDVRTTKYVSPRTGLVSWIHYDYAAEVATLKIAIPRKSIFSKEPEIKEFKCPFGQLDEILKEQGMYTVLPREKRHSLAGPQAGGNDAHLFSNRGDDGRR